MEVDTGRFSSQALKRRSSGGPAPEQGQGPGPEDKRGHRAEPIEEERPLPTHTAGNSDRSTHQEERAQPHFLPCI